MCSNYLQKATMQKSTEIQKLCAISTLTQLIQICGNLMASFSQVSTKKMFFFLVRSYLQVVSDGTTDSFSLIESIFQNCSEIAVCLALINTVYV